jgi:cytoskeletal protein CcmA (bactofilin family)
MINGDVHLAEFRVGGHAQIGGGTISGEAEVKGHLWVDRKLKFGRLRVYGHARLPPESSGEVLSGVGKVEFEGDFACKVVRIDGIAKAAGSLDADEVEVNGSLEVRGGLRASERLAVGGAVEVEEGVECGALDLRGRLAGGKIEVEGDARLAGELDAGKGLWAKSVLVDGGARCVGVLVAERVEVGRSKLVLLNRSARFAGQEIVARGAGRMTSVGDIYGEEVVVGANARCGRVFAKRVDLGAGCEVGHVTYTEELNAPRRVRFHSLPVKVEKLPDPPP